MQDSFSYITNPEKFGPGTWWTMHTLAYKADNYVDNAAVANNIKYIIDNLPCIDPCRKHAQAYWNQDPATNYLTQSKGVFWWTVDFHNAVNKRLNKENPERPAKPIFTKQQALQLYGLSTSVCTVNCDGHNKTNGVSTINPLTNGQVYNNVMNPLTNGQVYSNVTNPLPSNQTYSATPHYRIVIRPLSPPRSSV